MRPLHRLALTAALGAVAGMLAGRATVADLALPPVKTTGGAAGGRSPPDAIRAATAGDDAGVAEGCAGCSDYDLGFRFAAARGIVTADECVGYSWSYQRGCLAWLRQ